MKLKDRFLIVKRAVIVAVKPNLKNVTFMWSYEDSIHVDTHVVFKDGTKPTDIIFNYFAQVVGESNSLKALNKRVRSLLNKIGESYCTHNCVDPKSIRYTVNPFVSRGYGRD